MSHVIRRVFRPGSNGATKKDLPPVPPPLESPLRCVVAPSCYSCNATHLKRLPCHTNCPYILLVIHPTSLERGEKTEDPAFHTCAQTKPLPAAKGDEEVKTASGVFRRIDLQWKDINYTVREGKKGEVEKKVRLT